MVSTLHTGVANSFEATPSWWTACSTSSPPPAMPGPGTCRPADLGLAADKLDYTEAFADRRRAAWRWPMARLHRLVDGHLRRWTPGGKLVETDPARPIEPAILHHTLAPRLYGMVIVGTAGAEYETRAWWRPITPKPATGLGISHQRRRASRAATAGSAMPGSMAAARCEHARWFKNRAADLATGNVDYQGTTRPAITPIRTRSWRCT